MEGNILLRTDGNSNIDFDYGLALLTQQGGWTLGEFDIDINVRGRTEETDICFNRAIMDNFKKVLSKEYE